MGDWLLVIREEEETRLETVPLGTFSISAFQCFSFYFPSGRRMAIRNETTDFAESTDEEVM